MIVYAESSAVLSWLLGESSGAAIAAILKQAESTITSELTFVECDRAFHQGVASGRLTESMAKRSSAELAGTTGAWTVIRFLPPVLTRARQRFPNEPIRALDALHVSTALHARRTNPDLALLSLDDRIRRVGISLGFELLPK